MRTEKDVSRLRALTADNRTQQTALDLLEPVVRQRLSVSRTIIRETEHGNFDAALQIIRTRRGRVLADQAATIINGMAGEERRLLASRRIAAELTTRRTFACVLAFTALAMCGGLLTTMMLFGQRRERQSRDMERSLLQQTRQAQARLEALNNAGARFSAELSEDDLVETVVQAARELTGAECTALLKRQASADGQGLWSLASFAGAPREAFTYFESPRATALLARTLEVEQVFRCDDVLADPRHGGLGDVPPGHLPVRSYMAVAVVSRSGSMIGVLAFWPFRARQVWHS